MADWKTVVRIGDIHAGYENHTLSAQEVGRTLAARLRGSPYADELMGEIELLECVEDVEDYDEILTSLYDFGDTDHRIWFDPQ